MYQSVASGIICAKPCATMGIYFGVPTMASNNEKNKSYIKMYFKTQINVRESHLDYTALSLFGELGGYMGLLLGISFMNTTALFHMAIQYFIKKLQFKYNFRNKD